MRRSVARVIGLALLAGCGAPPAGPAPGPDLDAPAPAELARPDPPRLQPVARFRLPGEHVRAYERSIQLSTDGTRVALGTRDPNGTMSFTQVWRLGPQPEVLFESPKELGGGVFALSPSGKRLLASGVASAKAFDVDAGMPLGTPTGAERFSHAFFRDERVAVWTHRSHDFHAPRRVKVYVWDLVADADAGTFEIPDDRFQLAQPARGGAELWLYRSNALARLDRIDCYDVAAGTLVRTVKLDPDKPRQPDERYGPGWLTRTAGNKATGGTVGPEDLVLVEWQTGRWLAALAGFRPVPDESFHGADSRDEVSADGRTAVVVSRNGMVMVFDLSGVK